jgi:hypothetical protein
MNIQLIPGANFYFRIFFLVLGLSPDSFLAQPSAPAALKPIFKLQHKGRFYATWGYNRAWYNKSDIHFSGQGHDFVLSDVKAKDRPSKISFEYINPKLISIPQFNFRFGYFISDKYSVSIGWDHMKYIATDFQTVNMTGKVDPSSITDPGIKANMEQLNSLYAKSGQYDHVAVQMTPNDFVHLEHTDGLNYASIDLERYELLWQDLKHSKLGLSLISGAGAGAILPRTDAHLFGSGRNHYWNLSGWGACAKVGLQFNLFRHFYLQSDFKTGYLQMLKIHTTDHPDVNKAQQHIVFYECYWHFGFSF